MKRQNLAVCCVALALVACDKKSTTQDTPPTATATATETTPETAVPNPDIPIPSAVGKLVVMPLRHASMILKSGDFVVAVDPVKDALEAAPGDEPKADLILITDIHPDHLDPEAIAALRKEGAPVVAPQAVVDQAGEALPNPTVIGDEESQSILLAAGNPIGEKSIEIEAVPMYNIERKREDTGEPYHVKGRGNGYIVSLAGERIYIAGDTECIPEMKALTNIDVAFVPMNLPYTMTVEEAAECIAAFKPKVVYPYHFRGQDPSKLNELLADTGIEVRLPTWYPGGE